MRVLFETIHGSHLYGLNHAGSDLDLYIVADVHGRPKHTVKDGLDLTIVPLSHFMAQAHTGVPQALEAMFSESVSHDGPFQSMRLNYRAGLGDCVDKYTRTVRNFAHGTVKQQRHAMRLSMNLRDIANTGRFNPTLNAEDRKLILSHEEIIDPDEYLESLSKTYMIDMRGKND